MPQAHSHGCVLRDEFQPPAQEGWCCLWLEDTCPRANEILTWTNSICLAATRTRSASLYALHYKPKLFSLASYPSCRTHTRHLPGIISLLHTQPQEQACKTGWSHSDLYICYLTLKPHIKIQGSSYPICQVRFLKKKVNETIRCYYEGRISNWKLPCKWLSNNLWQVW